MDLTRRGLGRSVAAGLGYALVGSVAQAFPRPPRFATPRSQFIEVEPREPVGHIVLTDLAGRRQTLSKLQGKAVLLSFWASWCPPCRTEVPLLHALQQQAPGDSFHVVPVSLDRDARTARRFLDRLGLDGFKTFIDIDGGVASGPNSRVATPFPLFGMPMSYVINADGESVGYLSGSADWTRPEAVALLRFYAGAQANAASE